MKLKKSVIYKSFVFDVTVLEEYCEKYVAANQEERKDILQDLYQIIEMRILYVDDKEVDKYIKDQKVIEFVKANGVEKISENINRYQRLADMWRKIERKAKHGKEKSK